MFAGYINTIEYYEDKNNKYGNALIRLALLEIVNIANNPSEIMFVSNKKNLFVTFKTIAKWTTENPVTKQILEWMLHVFEVTRKFHD